VYQYDTFKEANYVVSAAVFAVVKHLSDSLKTSSHVQCFQLGTICSLHNPTAIRLRERHAVLMDMGLANSISQVYL